jgi:hypothetical protein
MKNIRNILLIAVLSIFIGFLFIANAPHPSYLCEGLSPGDPCQLYTMGCGDSSGVCELQEDCNDNPETDINECLFCVDD